MSRQEVESLGANSRLSDNKARVLSSFTLDVDGDDTSVAQCLLNDGYWEAWITSWMTKVIQPNWNCLDIGANFGYYTGVMATLSGTGQIVAFEANPEIASCVMNSVEGNGWTNVDVNSIAVGAEDGTLPLTLSKHFQGSASLLHGEDHFLQWDSAENITVCQVPVKTLDSMIKHDGWDFIKIDIEGWEAEMWKGAKEVLSKSDPLIAIEITPEHPTDFIDMLFNSYNVTNINTDGNEEPVLRDLIPLQNWWMLVLRRKI
jgi:FkbM family methyltransferase